MENSLEHRENNLEMLAIEVDTNSGAEKRISETCITWTPLRDPLMSVFLLIEGIFCTSGGSGVQGRRYYLEAFGTGVMCRTQHLYLVHAFNRFYSHVDDIKGNAGRVAKAEVHRGNTPT